MTERVNPMTVKCTYCDANPLRPCVLRGSRDEHNGYRGKILSTYHPCRVEAAHALLMADA